MRAHVELARDRGLNWQAALIEDAESDIKVIVKEAVMKKQTWAMTNKKVVALVDDVVNDLESPTLKEKLLTSLLRYASEQYRKMNVAFGDLTIPLSLIIAASKGNTTSRQNVQIAQALQKRTPIRSPTLPSDIKQAGSGDTEYVDIAAPLRKWCKRYIDEDVRPTFSELASSTAKDELNGRVSLRNIAEMTVRFDKNQNQIANLRAQGVRLVWTSSHANCSVRCERWQGRLYSLDGTSGTQDGISFIPLETAMNVPYTTKAGKTYMNGIISGYNCRHFLIPYQKGNRPIPVSAKTVEKYRDIDQTQREMERQVRYYKNMSLVYKGEDDKLSAHYARSAKAAYKRYQQYSEENQVAYYPSRTEVFPEEKGLLKEQIRDKIELRNEFNRTVETGAIRLSHNTGGTNKHFKTHSYYVHGKSYFTIPQEELEEILRRRIGTGEIIKEKDGVLREVLTFTKPIGKILRKDGTEEDAWAVKIHFSKKGYHAVPKRR